MNTAPTRFVLLTIVPFLLWTPELSAQKGKVDTVRVKQYEQPPVLSPPAHVIQRPDLLAGERPTIMVTGYWPPTNEMIRHFSDDPALNPNGWQGEDWEGRGYDIHAYFPEFVPPTCMCCGKGTGDLEVDYQDTSNDFWPLAEAISPIAIVTFSRGNPDSSWEVEMNQFNRDSWIPDYQAPQMPTPNPPDPDVPIDHLRLSNLPAQQIVNTIDELPFNIVPFICFSRDGGGFLSEFMAYHGVWYRDLHSEPSDPDWCAFGGHVHVGQLVSIGRARLATEATLRVVISALGDVLPQVVCQPDLGFAGPGASSLSVCGDPLATGGTAALRLTGAPPLTSGFLALGLSNTPTPFMGGLLVPVPILKSIPFATNASGGFTLPALAGGGGPVTGYLQAVLVDESQPLGFGLSNALQLDIQH
jgi:hypothetical protein